MRSPKFDMEITSPENLPEDIKAKVLRRAKRHFEGKNVVHRVVSKNDSVISFKFNRQTNKYSSLSFRTIVTVIKVVPEKKSPATKKPAVKRAVKAPKAPKSPATKKPAVKKAVKASKSPSIKEGSNLKDKKPFDWSPV